MIDFGKLLIILGGAILLFGLFFTFLSKTSNIGKLPGDILIQKENLTIYFPIASSIIISIVLSFIFWIFKK